MAVGATGLAAFVVLILAGCTVSSTNEASLTLPDLTALTSELGAVAEDCSKSDVWSNVDADPGVFDAECVEIASTDLIAGPEDVLANLEQVVLAEHPNAVLASRGCDHDFGALKTGMRRCSLLFLMSPESSTGIRAMVFASADYSSLMELDDLRDANGWLTPAHFEGIPAVMSVVVMVGDPFASVNH